MTTWLDAIARAISSRFAVIGSSGGNSGRGRFARRAASCSRVYCGRPAGRGPDGRRIGAAGTRVPAGWGKPKNFVNLATCYQPVVDVTHRRSTVRQ
jgi:hypothetical protein